MTEKSLPEIQPKVSGHGGSVTFSELQQHVRDLAAQDKRYLTGFLVLIKPDLEVEVHLDPPLPENVTTVRKATDHDWDVAGLWIDKFRAKR